jgi:phage terminase small subunit
MPRRKLPRNVVEMRGNPGKRAINAAEPVSEAISSFAPPRKLKAEAKREWDRVIGFLSNNGIIGAECLSILATYCMVHAKIVELETAGMPIEAATLTQYRMLASEFGLTPTGRAKLKTGNGKTQNEDEKRFFGS